MEYSDDMKRVLNRKDVLRSAEHVVIKGRNEQYGEPEDSFNTIARFWSEYLSAAIGKPFGMDSTDVAAMMALLKIARIATDSGNADSWVDLAGYAACGGECAQIAVDG